MSSSRRTTIRRTTTTMTNYRYALIAIVACIFIAVANFYHVMTDWSSSAALLAFDGLSLLPSRDEFAPTGSSSSSNNHHSKQQQQQQQHRIAGLSCQAYGGPDDAVAAEMVYWKDIPADASFVSPLLKRKTTSSDSQENKEYYLTFEPDEGGWNNIRMAMETAVMMAIASGRTLVLPPRQGFYLLHSNQSKFGFGDFFHFDSIQTEHAGVKIITFEDFLKQTAMQGKLVDATTGQPSFPPYNRTDWNDFGFKNYQAGREGQGKVLWGWLRSVTTRLEWQNDQCVAAFPSDTSQAAVQQLQQALQDVLAQDAQLQRGWRKRIQSFVGRPTPVNASVTDRLAEMLADRTKLCVYDEPLQQAPVLHLLGEQTSGHRLLVHFYAFLFFQDWKQDLWTKRFVRDHLRYTDEIQCAAARVVQAVRERSKQRGDPTGSYDSMHIRRNDFQYKDMWMSAEDIYRNNTKNMLKEGRTVFIATDEKKFDFFEPLQKHYHVLFLKDFQHLLKDLNPNYYGMVDQLVASRGQTFVGVYFSTFSAYINRIRGYHAQNNKEQGYEQGIIDSYYYAPNSRPRVRGIMRQYSSVSQGFWQQEFPVCWRDIDHDVVI